MSAQELETRMLAAGTPEAPDLAAVAAAARVIRDGGLVAFPTDTVYGVGGDPWSAAAVVRIYRAKLRPEGMPIPVLVSSRQAAERLAAELPPSFGRLAEHFWPGGLTLVVPARPELPDVLLAGGRTVALRMPDHALALALIDAVGGALAATSANISGRPAACSAAEALADLAGRVALVLDGGPSPVGAASTIVDLASQPARLLRPGAVPQETLRRWLPDLVVPASG